jgi:outer membrane beta-barrel protein
MKKSWTWLWISSSVALASSLGVLPLDTTSSAKAQMEFSLDETETPPEETPPADTPPPPTGSGDIFNDIVSDVATDTTDEAGSDAPQQDEQVEEVFAIQRVYALRRHRVEMSPSFAINLNDPYQSRIGVGLGLNYWFTNVLAIGVNAIWYDLGSASAEESNTSFFTRRSTRLGIPLNEWQAGAWLNFTYVPIYGKFAAFNRFIFEWDTYIVGGVGMQRTRPIPVFDPSVRNFDWGTRVSFNAGLGIRVFLSRWLAINIEFRDYIFLERYENTRIPVDIAERSDPGNWLANGSSVTHNASIQVGFTVFIPPSFDYQQPK